MPPQTPPGIFSALCIKRTNNVAESSRDANHHVDMQDKSIDGALLALRKQIIRGDGNGLCHIEALLRQRGVHMPAVLPAKRKDVAGKGLMAIWVMQALQDGKRRLAPTFHPIV
jgi:hypothetical protein